MNILRFALVVFAVSALSQTAFAQQAPGYGPGPGSGDASAAENFPDTKARVLKMLDERRAGIDQERACVQKAGNIEDLRKCRPRRPMRGGRGERGWNGQVRPADPRPESR